MPLNLLQHLESRSWEPYYQGVLILILRLHFPFSNLSSVCSSDKGGGCQLDSSSNMEQTNNKCAEILKNSDADTNVEELVKKNEKLTEAVKKLKTFIKSSNEDFERKDDEIKKKEEEIERLETENKKLKQKLWDSKLKIKDFIQNLHEKRHRSSRKR